MVQFSTTIAYNSFEIGEDREGVHKEFSYINVKGNGSYRKCVPDVAISFIKKYDTLLQVPAICQDSHISTLVYFWSSFLEI